MINIKELSVDNWIQNTNGNIGKVIGITEQGEVIMRYHANSTCYSEPSMLKPIPVTEEILEKNGFGYKEYTDTIDYDFTDKRLTHFYPGEECYCADMDFHIGTNNKGNFWINYHHEDLHFKYVHQLQNAFTLFGINKEITL